MKVVILAGGFGTRLSEETRRIPKPLVEIGGKPILWHIMKHYSHYGYNEFIICLGYKGSLIKEYFSKYFIQNSSFTIDLKNNSVNIHDQSVEPWKITLIDTGLNSLTGKRLKQIASHIGNETFMLTYGDGIGDVDISRLLDFHKSHGKLATVTSVVPKGKFGALKLEENKVVEFAEKRDTAKTWISAGFFVLEPGIFNYIREDNVAWEATPLENLAKNGQLMTYPHSGFWHPMDKLSDKLKLEKLWNEGNSPWKLWSN